MSVIRSVLWSQSLPSVSYMLSLCVYDFLCVTLVRLFIEFSTPEEVTDMLSRNGNKELTLPGA